MIETKYRQKILTNKIDLYIIELPKLMKKKRKKLDDKLTQWLLYLENPYSMVKNHHLSKSIIDASWYELIRQIEYKDKWNGRKYIDRRKIL